MSSHVVLTIDGAVDSPAGLTIEDLAGVDEKFQIEDVSRLDAARQGQAVLLEGIIDLARPARSVTHLTLHASLDDFHASVPLEAVRQRGLFIYQSGGRPLESSAGGPVRFYIPQYATCRSDEVDECANVKFVDRVEFTVGKGLDTRPEDDEQHQALHRDEQS